MSNPFNKIRNNARDSKSKQFEYLEKKEVTLKTISCQSCGAPRPAKSNLVKCMYCNEEFMDIDAKINSL